MNCEISEVVVAEFRVTQQTFTEVTVKDHKKKFSMIAVAGDISK